VIALSTRHGRNVPYAFNRKEAKDHGEGGTVVGTPLRGRVLVVDDVITAGTAIRESLEIIRNAGAQPAAVALALDRQERGQGNTSAVQEIESQHGLTCVSVVTLADLIETLARPPDGRARISAEQLTSLRDYRQRYGVS
ncbi:orotate phosphoribosyltransferase, partial [Actinomadura sp. DSM 109109]|nr:orotate phosphoribosyltransferase [Actinomadura lepetitiana]